MRRVVLAGILGIGMIAGAIGFAAPDNAAADWWNNGWLEERSGRDIDPDGPYLNGPPPPTVSEESTANPSESDDLDILLQIFVSVMRAFEDS